MPRPEPRHYSTDLGAMNQEQLLTYINQVSFVVSDMLLYLDTHPTDREALAYCEDHIAVRNKALKEYACLIYTSQNELYSFEGAEFGIYETEDFSGEPKVLLRTKETGETDTVTLPVGTCLLYTSYHKTDW